MSNGLVQRRVVHCIYLKSDPRVVGTTPLDQSYTCRGTCPTPDHLGLDFLSLTRDPGRCAAVCTIW